MSSQYDQSRLLPNDQMVDPSYLRAELDAIYTRSVNSFFCPVCSMGRCRVVIESQNLPFEEWLYECVHCNARGTKAGIYASLNCQMCGRTLNEWGRCPTGCLDNQTAAAVIATSVPLVKSWTLLAMVRIASPETWYSGQSVWIVPGKAFLKESAGWVRLHVVGEGRSLPVYIFNPLAGWVEVVGLDREFAKWIKGE